jgi:hypothetical protein
MAQIRTLFEAGKNIERPIEKVITYQASQEHSASSVSQEDSMRFVSSAVSDGRTTKRWSQTTVIRVARYLLGACADFGLLGPFRNGERSITTFRITPNVASILAHDLHYRGMGDNTEALWARAR